jgi:hypothetical protein
VAASRRKPIDALGVAFAMFLLYAATAANHVTGDDAGELIAAAYHLGIPHPPGYPLWCLVAHAFTWIPCGSIPWRVALCSAFFGAATIGILVRLFHELSGNRGAAILGALAVGLSQEFWKQSVIPEVYTLNAFFVALCWWLLVQWNDRRDDRLLWAFAVVYGFSLGNHHTMHLLGPVFGLFILIQERAPLRRAWVYARMFALSLGIAFVLHLYLPLRSLADPPVDWGDPETLAGWWHHVSRGQYAFMVTESPRSFARAGMQAAVTAQLWWEQHTLGQWSVNLPWLIALPGLVLLFRKHTAIALLFLVSGMVVSTGFAVVQNFDDTIEWRWVMAVFGLPLYMVTGACIAHTFPSGSVPGWRTVAAISLVAGLVSSILNAPVQRGNDTADRYARAFLDCLPPDAVLVPHGDHQSFTALYLQTVEGLRPDVSIARKYGYLDSALWKEAPQSLREAWGSAPARRHEPEMITWLLENTNRPMFFFRTTALPGVRFAPCGVLSQALRSGERAACACDDVVIEPGYDTPLRDYTSRVIAYESLLEQAERHYGTGDTAAARAALDAALAGYGTDTTSLYNAGATAARHRDYAAASDYFGRAVARDPEHAHARAALKRLESATK